jgi:hypothetical protein
MSHINSGNSPHSAPRFQLGVSTYGLREWKMEREFASANNKQWAQESVQPPQSDAQGGHRVAAQAKTAEGPMWKRTVLQTTASGREEAFSIGPDDFVWSYLTGNADFSAGRLVSTGLSASVFTVGKLPSGGMVVVAAEGGKLRCVVETGDKKPRWSEPQAVHFKGLSDGAVIHKVVTQTLNQTLFVGVLTRKTGADGKDAYDFWDGVWVGDRPVFCNSPVEWRAENNIWWDAIARNARHVAVS